VRYTNVGLPKRIRRTDDHGSAELITLTQQPDELTEDFIASAKACATGQQRRERWRRALRTLESDPIFELKGEVVVAIKGSAAADAAQQSGLFKEVRLVTAGAEVAQAARLPEVRAGFKGSFIRPAARLCHE